MQGKAGPAVITIAVVVVLVLCIFMYKHFNPTPGGGTSTNPGDTYKPPYASSGTANPSANPTPRSKG